MCNLSQNIIEKGIAIGREKAREEVREEVREECINIGKEEVVLNMWKHGLTINQISSYTNKDTNEINAILKKNGLNSKENISDLEHSEDGA